MRVSANTDDNGAAGRVRVAEVIVHPLCCGPRTVGDVADEGVVGCRVAADNEIRKRRAERPFLGETVTHRPVRLGGQ